MILIKLFISFFIVGLLSFGGGYAAIPFIEQQVVLINGWLSINEFSNLISISNMAPGAIAVNSAAFVGAQIAGVSGAIIASLGCVIPSSIIVSILGYCYKKYQNIKFITAILEGLRPAVIAMIASVGVNILVFALFNSSVITWDIDAVDKVSLSIFIVSLISIVKFRLNPIFVIIGSGLIGGLCFYFFG